MMIVSKPYFEIRDGSDFEKEYETLLSIIKGAREETGVRIFIGLGVHPSRISDFKILEEAKIAMKKGIDIAAEYVTERKADAIGEVGRPHYPVDEETWEASNEIMEYAMMKAKEADCAVVIHSESSESTFKEISEIAGKVGIERRRVVKHFSPITKNTFGLTPSIIGSYKNAKEAFKSMEDFMLESDYIDDPDRPGVVISPKTLPRTVKRLMNEENVDVYRVMKDLPEKVYGIEIE